MADDFLCVYKRRFESLLLGLGRGRRERRESTEKDEGESKTRSVFPKGRTVDLKILVLLEETRDRPRWYLSLI